MGKIIALAALIAGAWLVYTGYERGQSLAGKTADSLSKLGQRIDGGDHMTDQTKYYLGGAALLVGGALGLGLVRK
jgi:hypothetical protein